MSWTWSWNLKNGFETRKLKSYYISNTQIFKNSNFNSQTMKLNMPGIVTVDSGHHLLKTCHATRNHLCGDLLKYQFHLLCYNISPTKEKLSSKKVPFTGIYTTCYIFKKKTIVHTCIWLSFTATVFDESPLASCPICKWVSLRRSPNCCNGWRKLPSDRLSTWSGLVTCKVYSFTRSCGTTTPSLCLKYLLVSHTFQLHQQKTNHTLRSPKNWWIAGDVEGDYMCRIGAFVFEDFGNTLGYTKRPGAIQPFILFAPSC